MFQILINLRKVHLLLTKEVYQKYIETKNNRPKSTRIKYTNIQFIKATFHHVILYGLIWNEVHTVIHIFSLKVDKCDFEQVEIKCTQSCQRNDIDIYLSRYH